MSSNCCLEGMLFSEQLRGRCVKDLFGFVDLFCAFCEC